MCSPALSPYSDLSLALQDISSCNGLKNTQSTRNSYLSECFPDFSLGYGKFMRLLQCGIHYKLYNPKELRTYIHTYILQSSSLSFGYDMVLRATINSLVNGPSLSQAFSPPLPTINKPMVVVVCMYVCIFLHIWWNFTQSCTQNRYSTRHIEKGNHAEYLRGKQNTIPLSTCHYAWKLPESSISSR